MPDSSGAARGGQCGILLPLQKRFMMHAARNILFFLFYELDFCRHRRRYRAATLTADKKL